MGKYVLDYKLFEEDQNVDITDELKNLGKGLQIKGDGIQDMITKLAASDPDIQKKKEEMGGNKDQEENQEETQEEDLNESNTYDIRKRFNSPDLKGGSLSSADWITYAHELEDEILDEAIQYTRREIRNKFNSPEVKGNEKYVSEWAMYAHRLEKELIHVLNEPVNEAVLTGLALSSGAILSMVGKFMKLIGKNLDKKDESRIFKIGQSIDKLGHNIHHKIIDLINLILKPLIFWMPKKKQQGVANVVFMCVLALKVSSGSFDPSDYKTAASMTEGLLNSVKATEIGSFLKDNGKNLLKFVKLI